MKAVVTGGLGFIGSHVCELLRSEGFEVLAIDDLSTGTKSNEIEGVRYELCAFSTKQSLKAISSFSPDFFFHLAALPRIQPSFEMPLEHHDTNARSVVILLEHLRDLDIKGFVFSSSASLYGDSVNLPLLETHSTKPISPYAIQKQCAENYVSVLGNYFGIPNISLRYFNPFGPRSHVLGGHQSAYSPVVGIFEHQARAGVPLTVTGDGSQTRDFVSVVDVARANLAGAMAAQEFSGEFYNVCTGKETSILQVALMFGCPIEFVPGRPGEANRSYGSFEKIARDIGWEPLLSLSDYISGWMAGQG